MARNNRKRRDNYRTAVERAASEGKFQATPGTVSILHVYHDDWCDFLKGGTCNCKPDLVQEFPAIPKGGDNPASTAP